MQRLSRVAYFGASLLAASCVSSMSMAGPVTIDDFDTGLFSISINGVGNAISQDAGATIIGGERDVYLQVTTAAAPNPDSETFVNMGTGLYQFTNANNARSNFVIQWDGADAQTNGGADFSNPDGELSFGLGGIDLTMGGAFDAFGSLFTLDTNIVNSIVRIYTDADHWSEHTFTKEGPASNFQHFAKYVNNGAADAFTAMGSLGGADFANVFAIVIAGEALPTANPNSTGALDLEISLINSISVPEPASVGLLGFGLLGLGAMRRRRKAAAAC